MHKIKPEFIQNLADIKVTGKAMKIPMFLGVVLLSSLLSVLLVEAQEPPPLVQFNNGEAADANDVNSNFNNHEQRLQALEQYQGCSAAQDGSSVVITCADGSSGILASEGTVVLYPVASASSAEGVTVNTGEIVIMDSDDSIIGLVSPINIKPSDFFPFFIKLTGVDEDGLEIAQNLTAWLYNDDKTHSVGLDGLNDDPSYTEEGCVGGTFFGNTNYIYSSDGIFYAPILPKVCGNFLLKSSKGAVCENIDPIVKQGCLWSSFTPPSGVLNAAYPVRLEQLP